MQLLAPPPTTPRDRTTTPSRRPRLSRQELALVGVTVIWGGTFLTVKHGLTMAGPFTFVTLRFAVAALALAALSPRLLRQVTRRELAVGSLIGLTLVAGYGLQTAGLQTIPSSTSAFLTALYVPAVPLLQWLVWRRRPHAGAWVGIACAFVGVLLLTGAGVGGIGLGTGEVLTVLAAIATAAEILLIGHVAGTVDARRVTIVQLAACAVFAGIGWPLSGEGLPHGDVAQLWLIVGVLGAATALIQVTINWAQRSVPPTRATVIYAGEPVWAGVVGRVAGERLGGASLVGAALVVVAVLVSELGPRPRRAAATEPVRPTVAVGGDEPVDALERVPALAATTGASSGS